ncbi:MAG: hypothetical protein R6U36_10695 [Candidatus Fermentibacteraceae bacterium]
MGEEKKDINYEFLLCLPEESDQEAELERFFDAVATAVQGIIQTENEAFRNTKPKGSGIATSFHYKPGKGRGKHIGLEISHSKDEVKAVSGEGLKNE